MDCKRKEGKENVILCKNVKKCKLLLRISKIYWGTKVTVELVHGEAIPIGYLAVENYHTER